MPQGRARFTSVNSITRLSRLSRIIRVPRLLSAAAATLGLLLTGCASPPPQSAGEALWRDTAYAAPSRPVPGAAELMALSPEMRRFADSALAAVAAGSGHGDPRRRLIDALYLPPSAQGAGLRLEYEASLTRTAAQAFEARAGNCLSLVLMTAAFAQHLGLPVTFQAVPVETWYTRQGSLTLASGHVNLVLAKHSLRKHIGSDPDLLVVDFLHAGEWLSRRSAALDESTVVAMYYNNRAAELLVQGHTTDAYWHARAALQHEPGFLHAANTLGVVHQRAGQADAAEAAFRHVLAQDGKATAALANLAGLLRAQGRADEAAALQARLVALQPVAPLHWLEQGRAALAAGDAARARQLLERELRRQPEQDEVHFVLAQALLALGDVRGASRHLAEAAEHSTRRSDQQRYRDKLSHLRASTTVR